MAKKAYVWDGSSWISISSVIPEVNTILPSQNGNSGKFLTTDGSIVSWGTVDLTPYATKSSPTFTGIPIGPTASQNTNTTQLATTQYVVGQASSTNPLINGSVSVGTSLKYAREDHIHPTDTSRAPLASPTFTGTVTVPAPINNTDAATKIYVDSLNISPFLLMGA